MRYFILLLALTSSALLHGQEKSKTRSCRILFLERPANTPHTMHLFDGRESLKVDLPKMNLSKEYTLPAGPLRLSLVPESVSSPEGLPAGAPFVNLPESMTDFYLLLFSDPSNMVAPVRMQVVDASMQRLRIGQTQWFNLTELTIGGRFGEQKIVIKPMSLLVMDAPRADGGDYPVSMAYRTADIDTPYPICETRWTHDPRARNLGFIISKKGVRTPRVFLIPDFRAKKEPEQHATQP